jgi:hypothetical protein
MQFAYTSRMRKDEHCNALQELFRVALLIGFKEYTMPFTA